MGHKYLIKKKNSTEYLKSSGVETYSSDVGCAIHDKLPSYVSENGDSEFEVIRSDNPDFKKILENELSGNRNFVGLLEKIRKSESELIKFKNHKSVIESTLKELNNF